jgi:hypothetical protein
MNRISPTINPHELGEVPLRVRFFPLWRWYFLGSFLCVETYLASRFWGGWDVVALLRILAIQVVFAPRLMLIAAAGSLVLTLLSDRLIRWIARPMSRRWLSPRDSMPPEAELTLYLRVGETTQEAFRGRIRTEFGWSPGWLVLTDLRLFWLSGIWRTIVWEIDRAESGDTFATRLSLTRPPRWLGGFVVGMPPRVVVERASAATPTAQAETIALQAPDHLLKAVAPIETEQTHAFVATPANPIQPPDSAGTHQRATDWAAITCDASAKRTPNGVELPRRRDLRSIARGRMPSVDDGETKRDRIENAANGVTLPPRRRLK